MIETIRMADGIDEFLIEEEKVLKLSRESFADEIKTFDFAFMVLKEIGESVNQMEGQEKDTVFPFLALFHIIHANLRAAFILVLRGYDLESLAVLRPALEMVSDLYIMGNSPREYAKIWLKQKENGFKKQYDKLFVKNRFRSNNEALKELEKVWISCCDHGAHASVNLLAYKSSVSKEEKLHKFHEVHGDSETSLGHLLYVLHCVQHVLKIAREVFGKVLSKQGFER